jgi:hypothetical protein
VYLAQPLWSLPVGQENYVHFMEPEGSLPCSQQTATAFYSESHDFSPNILTSILAIHIDKDCAWEHKI